MAIKSSDQISIVDLTDGYSVILTNDSFTFAGNISAAVGGSTTTTVIAMCGGTQVPAAVNNSAIVAPTGVTTSVDTDPTQPREIDHCLIRDDHDRHNDGQDDCRVCI